MCIWLSHYAAIWPCPTVCVFNQGVWKQSHIDSARHLSLICGVLMHACRPGSGKHKQPMASF